MDRTIVELYERHATAWNRDRGERSQQSTMEQPWLDRFLATVPAGGDVLDLGCGMGRPIAHYLIDRGCRVTGVDASPSLISMCRSRFPHHTWIASDMRELELNRQFDGVLAWDSFFHLSRDDQRAMFPRFAAHARTGGALMFTSGPRDGEVYGTYEGEPLFHASLSPDEYTQRLEDHGFAVEAFVPDDPTCGGHSVWLAARR